MAQDIPLRPSEPWYRMTTPLADAPTPGTTTTYHFDFRWNVRDSSWYFDMLEQDETPIIQGVRVVLGMYLGRRSRHPFFRHNVIVAVNTSSARGDDGREATLDDFGARVILRVFTAYDILIGRGVLPSSLAPSDEQTSE